MTDPYEKIEREIAKLRAGRGIPCTRTIRLLLDVARAAEDARTPDEYGLLSIEKSWVLDKALSALREHYDE